MYSQTWEKYVNRIKKYVRIQTILRMHLYNYNVLCINNHSKAIGFKTLMQMSVFKILMHSICILISSIHEYTCINKLENYFSCGTFWCYE